MLAERLRVPDQIHSYRGGTSDITDFDEPIAFSVREPVVVVAGNNYFQCGRGEIDSFPRLN